MQKVLVPFDNTSVSIETEKMKHRILQHIQYFTIFSKILELQILNTKTKRISSF